MTFAEHQQYSRLTANSMAPMQRYVYLVIMYSVHVELAVSPVNAGYLVRMVSLCYT